ncbi:MAG: FAD:protein FMN transferase [Clostridia bacterium]|nr:FAD:protein FMN transferase [Clostridia bacterium]
MKRRFAVFFIILALCGGLCGCAHAQSYRYTVPDTFDTLIDIICYTSQDDAETYGKQAEEMLDGWHRLCDAYRPWEGVVGVYTVNQKAGQWVEISKELQDLLTFGVEMYRQTDGAVNVMGGAVTALWKDTEAPPSESAIASALQHIDINALEIENGRVRIADPDARIDVGAFAKGYALQKTADALRASGFKGLLSAVSSVVAVGDKNGEPFAVGLSDGVGGVAETVYLKDGEALSTSGTEQRFFVYQEKKYHHITDLTTGYPADSGIAQVSVVHRDAGWADAFSTAALITGESDGTVWIRWEDKDDISQ